MRATAAEALSALPREGRVLLGDAASVFTRASTLAESDPSAVTFFKGSAAAVLDEVAAACVVVAASLSEPLAAGLPEGVASAIVSPNPRLDFIRILRAFSDEVRSRPTSGEGDAAHAEARVAPTAFVHPRAVLGRCVVGARSVIGPGAVIMDDVTIGEDCVVAAGAVLGGDGFGFERDEQGVPLRFPHIGSVVIGDRVEIGSNTCIDRGALGRTVVEDDVKIDNLVHVAHNVHLGARTMIAATAVIAGSARIGRGVWVGPHACVSNGLVVGDGAIVTLGAVVTKDVANGVRVTGNFAVEHAAFLRHLKSMNDRV